MIKFNNIKIGDLLRAEYEGQIKDGEVVLLNGDEKQVCVKTDVQDFWFETEHLQGIPLNDEALTKLKFTKLRTEEGEVKYMKGAFRLVIKTPGDFSHIDMWYREDKRHNPNVHFVHELQNQYHDMTKVHLTAEPV